MKITGEGNDKATHSAECIPLPWRHIQWFGVGLCFPLGSGVEFRGPRCQTWPGAPLAGWLTASILESIGFGCGSSCFGIIKKKINVPCLGLPMKTVQKLSLVQNAVCVRAGP